MIVYQNLWLKILPETQNKLYLIDGQEIHTLEEFMSIVDYVLENDCSIEMGEL